MDAKETTALVLLVDGVEEIEAVTPIDLLRRAGIRVTTATVGVTGTVSGRSEIELASERTISEVADQWFDVVVLPGGPGVNNLRKSAEVIQMVTRHANDGRLIAAICAAPTVLLDAGLLKTRRHTAHFSVKGELAELLESEEVVLDGNILTSRGAGTAIPFALEIIRILCSPNTAEKVAAAICFTNQHSHGKTL